MTENKEYEDWLLTRPQIIQNLARKYPPGEYEMSDDAPYGLTCPGTVVSLEGYSETGEVIVSIIPGNWRPEAIKYSNRILHPQGRDHSELAKLVISAHVDPQYLLSLNRETK